MAKLPWEVKLHIKYQDDVEEIYKKEPLKENKYLVITLNFKTIILSLPTGILKFDHTSKL